VENWEGKAEKDFMNTDEIKLEKKNEIGIIILNKPSMNLLETKMLLLLEDCLDKMENDETIRAVIITGGKNFCAGADIKELKEKHPEEALVFSGLGHKVCSLWKIWESL
jgi:enoyl-CoA hydratase